MNLRAQISAFREIVLAPERLPAYIFTMENQPWRWQGLERIYARMVEAAEKGDETAFKEHLSKARSAVAEIWSFHDQRPNGHDPEPEALPETQLIEVPWLQRRVWYAMDEAAAKKIPKDGCAVYLAAELRRLKGADRATLSLVQMCKEIFPGCEVVS